MEPDQIKQEVARLQGILEERKRKAAEEYQEGLRKTLRYRLAMFEAGRLEMNCTCPACLEAHVTEDPAKLCPQGWSCVTRY